MDQSRDQRAHLRCKTIQTCLSTYSGKALRINCLRVGYIGSQCAAFINTGAGLRFGLSCAFRAMRMLGVGIDSMVVMVMIVIVVMAVIMMMMVVMVMVIRRLKTAHACAKRITQSAVCHI